MFIIQFLCAVSSKGKPKFFVFGFECQLIAKMINDLATIFLFYLFLYQISDLLTELILKIPMSTW